MKLKKMDVNKHSPRKVAELIYEADTDTFDFFYGDQARTAEVIEKLVLAGGNTLGHEQIYVVCDDDEWVLGVLVINQGKNPNILDELKIIFKCLSILDSLKFFIISLLDRMFLSDLDDDDYYLAIIAVDETCRGQGIGSFILEKGVELARQSGSKRAVLLVDLNNFGALRLYERFCFKKFNKKSIPWFGGEKGAVNMELLI
ncbi:MAG: GNAT family N-acetyltransferase [Methanobacteriaceae archaeon]|nr:GNAT family N-acetyltransferase [Methanobacteriaceae archaeon]